MGLIIFLPIFSLMTTPKILVEIFEAYFLGGPEKGRLSLYFDALRRVHRGFFVPIECPLA